MQPISLRGRRLVIPGVVCAVLAVALTGCGSNGASSASPEATWADGLCTALTTWKTSLKSAGTTLKNADQPSKGNLDQAAADVASANAELNSALRTLGGPPQTAAPEARAAVQELSTQLENAAREIGTAAQGVSSGQDIVHAASVASAALQALPAEISSTVTKLESLHATDKWKQAFSDSSACRSLRNS
jgi:flagellar hook-basal body complex protein FliE